MIYGLLVSLKPRRNPVAFTRLARMVGKFRYYRSIGCNPWEAITWAWRASR